MKRRLPDWPPRDWRMLAALLLLAGGGMACSLALKAVIDAIAGGAWPDAVAGLRIKWLGYIALGLTGLIAIVLTSYGFVLGRRVWRVKAGRWMDAEASGGEEETSGPAGAMDTRGE